MRFPVAAAAAAGGVAAHLVQGLWRPNSGISLSWWLLLICAAYGALLGWGAWARSRRALLISLRERARRAEAEQGRRVAEARIAERHALAREMHDVLAHRLSLVATHAGALEYRPDSSPEQLSRAAGVVRTGVHQALDELREVIRLLREEDGGDDGAGPQPHVRRPAAAGRRSTAGRPADAACATRPPTSPDSRRPPPDRLPGRAGGADQRTQARPRTAGRVAAARRSPGDLLIDVREPAARSGPPLPSLGRRDSAWSG